MNRAWIALSLIFSFSAFAQNNVDQVLDWSRKFIAQYGTSTLQGKTDDGKLCEFSIFDQSFKGGSPCGEIDQREAYVSLGTQAPDGRTYVGFKINPDCGFQGIYEVKAMDVTPDSIHIDILHDEVDAPHVENSLLIKLSADGRVTDVQGTSSHWPGSTCRF